MIGSKLDPFYLYPIYDFPALCFQVPPEETSLPDFALDQMLLHDQQYAQNAMRTACLQPVRHGAGMLAPLAGGYRTPLTFATSQPIKL